MSDEQKFEVARYCIETRCVIANVNPDGTIEYLWRVQQTMTAKEVCKDLGITVTPSHLRSSLEFHALVCKLSGKMPVYPAMESPMELDRLIGENKRLINDRERQENLIKNLKDDLKKKEEAVFSNHDKNKNYLDALHQIGKLIPPEAFSIKRHPSPR